MAVKVPRRLQRLVWDRVRERLRIEANIAGEHVDELLDEGWPEEAVHEAWQRAFDQVTAYAEARGERWRDEG